MVDKKKGRHIRVMGGMLLKGNIVFDVARFMKILQKAPNNPLITNLPLIFFYCKNKKIEYSTYLFRKINKKSLLELNAQSRRGRGKERGRGKTCFCKT